MKRKPIKVDWEGVEDAFNSQNEELVYYLDLVTGHVVLEGEGEAGDFDEDEGRFERPAASVPQKDSTRAYVAPPDLEVKLEWLAAFLDGTPDLEPGVAEALSQAIDADDPAAEIGAILGDAAAARDRWFLYRTERLHGLIDAWITDNGIQFTDPPPWR